MNSLGKADSCRVCSRALFPEPLLKYAGMPVAAQNLPDRETVREDRGVDLEVCQCTGCGLVQLNSPPVPYYREVIRAAAFSPEMRDFRLRQFSDFVARFSLHGKKVAEIGCGKGEYLSLMAACGVQAYGVEQGKEAVIHCRGEGLEVFQGFVQDGVVLPDGPFDGFFILNFLEHLPDPNSVLGGICENLCEGGTGLVEVPNFDMILRTRLFSEFIGDHLFYFTADTLESTLRSNGLEVLELRAVWYDYILSAVVRKRQPLDVSAFADYREKITTELQRHVLRFPAGRVAVWGAGHQALAILALAGLGGAVRYVVDSAPFKQGRFTPATHIPIVPPETLAVDPVDSVIVMAGSYSDEVAGLVRQHCSARVEVAILRDHGLELLPSGELGKGGT